MFNEATYLLSLFEIVFDLDNQSFPVDTPTEVFYNARQIIAAMNSPNFIESSRSLSETADLTRTWLTETLASSLELDLAPSNSSSPMDVQKDEEEEEEERSPPAKRLRQSRGRAAIPSAGPSQASPFLVPSALPFANTSISRTTSQAGVSQGSELPSPIGAVAAPSSSQQGSRRSKRKRTGRK